MPETRFRVLWPDGTRETCYSPSLVVEEFLAAGTSYPLAEFVGRCRTALGIASERVRTKYGRPCGLALGQIARIEEAARGHAARPGARVVVEAFAHHEPPAPGPGGGQRNEGSAP